MSGEILHFEDGVFSGLVVSSPKNSQRGNNIIHSHPNIELHYCEEGSGFFKFMGSPRQFFFTRGWITILLGSLTHRVYAKSNTPYIRSVIEFPLALATSDPTNPLPDISQIIPSSGTPCHQIIVPNEKRPCVRALMNDLHNEATNWLSLPDHSLFRRRVSHLLSELLLKTTRFTPNQRSYGNEPSPHEIRLVQEMENLVRYSHVNKFSVSHLAKELGISQGHLLRIYQKVRNSNVRDFLNKTRFSLAEDQLRAGKSVTETAFICDYSEVTGFSKAFTKYMGISPNAYRQLLAKPG